MQCWAAKMAAAPLAAVQPGLWRIRAPETTRYKPICGKCHQHIAIGEPRLSTQAVHGRSQHLGCTELPLDTRLEDLPGWFELPDQRQAQARANWACLNISQDMPGSQSFNPSADAAMLDSSPGNGDSMDVSLAESGQGSGLAVAAEHWMDDPTEGAREEDQPRAGLISMQLRSMEFWATVGWTVV